MVQQRKRIGVLAFGLFLFLLSGTSAYRYALRHREASIEAGLSRFGIRMVPIPGGTFRMGDTQVDEALRPFYRVHAVTVSSFRMSETEITEAQYRNVLGSRDIIAAVNTHYPKAYINWLDAARFCNILSRQFHLEPCYDEYFRECDYSRNGFRLPSEAEWEYACRAGTTTRYYSGDTEIDLARAAWYRGNSRQQTQPAGRKEPNAFGLYDMSGNVFEWCNDWFVPYSPEPVRNPTGIRRGSNRVLRGGSWYNSSSVCRSAFRHFGDPDNRRAYVGFRIVRGVK